MAPTTIGPPGLRALSEGSSRPLAERFDGGALVVGERLTPDIERANQAGVASLLVLSGPTSGVDLVLAGVTQRPTYVGLDRVSGLLRLHPWAQREEVGGWACGGWLCLVSPAGVALVGHGDGVDALRALCLAWWDAGGQDDAMVREALAGVRL